jgi:hypothetical protein
MANNFSVLEGLAGIKRAAVGAADGSMLHAVGCTPAEAEELTGPAAVFWRQMNMIGQILQLAACNIITVRSERVSQVLVQRRGSIATFDVEPKRLTPELETKLRAVDWTAMPTPVRPPSVTAVPAPIPPKPPIPPPVGHRVAEGIPGKATSGDMGNAASAEGSAARGPISSRAAETGKRPEQQRQPQLPSLPTTPPGPAAPAVSGAVSVNDVSTTGHHVAINTEVMLRGDLALVCVPDLLEFLRSGKRTGKLLCSSVGTSGSLRMRKGRIVEAVSPCTAQTPLLTRLIESGEASEEQAKAIAGEQEQLEDAVVARRLIDGGFTNPETVRRALLGQIQNAIKEMIGWTEGSFTFYPGEEEAVPPEAVIEADAQVILLNIFKEQDEAGR